MTLSTHALPSPRSQPLRGGPVLRWGVVAPGGIAADFVHALHAYTDQRVVAVASRSPERAAEFARRHDIARSHGEYAHLYADPDVQIVYVAAPHSEHLRLSLDAIGAGKHVLIEKPIGLSADEARTIRDAARAAGVFAMEAMWTRFLPQTDVMVQLRDDGVLGDVRLVTADLGFTAQPGGRLFDPRLGGGALLDIGVYSVWLSHLWLGAPSSVTARGTLAESGVDVQSAIVLAYPQDAQAVLSTSLQVSSPGRAAVSGSLGNLDIDPSFVAPGGFELVVAAGGEPRARYDDPSGLSFREGMAWQAAAVARHVTDGLTESPLHPLQTTIDVMTVIDAARAQLGVVEA
ncbi:Gfo/Idh/MocA family protein [Agromyces salentinus]|uniref:Gfo/Idh/MocA family oxidoreductase n=1 Tax=Agromyces salentinus TaxID=269421 RepID=A0ABP4Z680_9MICO|nr:Gfo/Idh/MocA family oxidoreductase [Agromyces salentinus]